MLRFFTRSEKILIAVLLVLIIGSAIMLYQRFIEDNSDLIPADGGIYTEGVVGRPQLLNPALLMGNAVDRDISQLVFSGLTRFNPHTGAIEDDLATSERSNNNLTYTFTLVPDAFWHDGTPVTSDDVMFTYQSVIQSEHFANAHLRQTFDGVKIEKIDEHKVAFHLPEPYSFFLANVTVGILPKHILELVPVANLDKSDFNQNPVGTGPYQFVGWIVNDGTREITLKRFDDYYAALPKIQTIIFRAFPDQESLKIAQNTLTGFRLPVDHSPEDYSQEGSRFEFFPYHLPQYSALFLNTQSKILSNKKVRFALLLATDKETIARAVDNALIVDTPILESKKGLDLEYSQERAMGAFFDTEWNLPEKVKQLEEEDDEKESEKKPARPSPPLSLSEASDLSFTVTADGGDSWISVIVDDGNLASVLLKKGDSKTYTVQKKLTFSTIGNAGGIAVSVNKLRLKKLGGDGEVVKNVVLDRKAIEERLTEESLEKLSSAESTTSDDTDLVEAEEDETEVISPEQAELRRVRVNADGDRLVLRLVTAQEPEVFFQVAELIQQQWLEVGVKVIIEAYPLAELQEKIQERDYDVLLFGQNLGYNLDAFPFWHSSQSKDGLNLSEYKSLETDNLLVSIRKTFDERTKEQLLSKLKKIIAKDNPAVFLYSPTHYYAVDKSFQNVNLESLSSHADRLTDLLSWFTKQEYRLRDSFHFTQFIQWLFSW